MISPRIKPSVFFPDQAPDDLYLLRQRKAKLEGYVQTLAAMDTLIDFSAMAGAVDTACPRPDRRKGGRPGDSAAIRRRFREAPRGHRVAG